MDGNTVYDREKTGNERIGIGKIVLRMKRVLKLDL